MGDSGDTVVKRVVNEISLHAVAANAFGYLAWWPSYHNNGLGAGLGGNLLQFEPNATTVPVANSVANPTGTTLATSGNFIVDPAAAILGQTNTSVFQAARTLAACMQVYYVGALQTCQGMLATIENLTPEQLMQPGSDIGSSVAQLLVFGESQRFPIEGAEVKWTPEEATRLRTEGSVSAAIGTVYGTADDCFIEGTPATNRSQFGPNAAKSSGIAICYSNLNSAVSADVRARLTKVVELEVNTSAGITEAKVKAQPPTASMYASAIEFLDHTRPGWKTTLSNLGKTLTMRAFSSLISGSQLPRLANY